MSDGDLFHDGLTELHTHLGGPVGSGIVCKLAQPGTR